MKSLEEIYTKILGSPSKGDLDDLERKYKEKSMEIAQDKDDNKVDISTIQKTGELQNAYLYLKAQWALQQKMNMGITENGIILKSNKRNLARSKDQDKIAHLPSDKLNLFNKELKGITKAGLGLVLFLSIFHLSNYIISEDKVNATTEFRPSVVETFRSQPVLKPQKNISPQNLAVIDKNIFHGEADSNLFRAAKNCNLNELKSNLPGENINSINSKGETTGHWLCRLNCAEGLRWALNNGADMSIKDNSGRTPIDWAKLNNSYESIQILNQFSK